MQELFHVLSSYQKKKKRKEKKRKFRVNKGDIKSKDNF